MEKFEHTIRVGWGDCDPARIVYTARIPAFALEAIDAWWENYLDGDGWYQMEMDRDVGTPFVHMSLDFLSPITPRHRLICEVWPIKLGEKSISFRVIGRQDGTVSFTGRFVCVFTLAHAFTSQPAPPDIREIVQDLIRPDIAE